MGGLRDAIIKSKNLDLHYKSVNFGTFGSFGAGVRPLDAPIIIIWYAFTPALVRVQLTHTGP